MRRKQNDRHLDVPGEANRDKHINYLAEERSEVDPASEPSQGPLSDDSNDRRDKQRGKTRTKKDSQ
ncbi:MAG TPA: hypothetical protein VFP87_15830 [Chitinophagaceae bacterium]|nr:hypothetical protein [Chitinophagaceae bacterium]